PMGIELGLSMPAIIAIIGTAGALGDAGSPASDSTLGSTAGLDADGQHDHIWDTCVPTFIFLNIPVLVTGFIAGMILLSNIQIHYHGNGFIIVINIGTEQKHVSYRFKTGNVYHSYAYIMAHTHYSDTPVFHEYDRYDDVRTRKCR